MLDHDAAWTPTDWANGLACTKPLSSFAKLMQTAVPSGVITPSIDKQIAAAYSEINLEDGSEEYLPLEIQGSWQIGYYKGVDGHPLPAPLDPMDIEGNRRKAHLTQEQLAELIGVNQAQISKWESGKAEPSEDNKRKLAEVFSKK